MTTTQQAHRECMARWAQAETIADLGQLGALWLEGEIPSQPGYERMCGPDPETAHLVPVLARLNRAGYFTCGSQPGVAPEDGDKYGHWQRAAVDGFIDDPRVMDRIISTIDSTPGLRLIVRRASQWRNGYRDAWPVTRVGGYDCTWFGVRLSRRYLRFLYGETGALSALRRVWQVTVIDEAWGRDDVLWAELDLALESDHA